jgi:hypothetical protein
MAKNIAIAATRPPGPKKLNAAETAVSVIVFARPSTF